jgi:hypothetical protein
LVTDSAPPPVTAGGGVFIAHVVVQMCILMSCSLYGWVARRPRLKRGNHPEKKNPAGFSGEQGSQIDDLRWIVSYLFASLARSSPPKLGRAFDASIPVMPAHKDTIARRCHVAVGECMEYVFVSFIGGESVSYIESC